MSDESDILDRVIRCPLYEAEEACVAEINRLRIRVADLEQGLITVKRWIDRGQFDKEAACVWITQVVGEAKAR